MIWLPFGNPEWLSTVPTPGGHAGKPKRASGWQTGLLALWL